MGIGVLVLGHAGSGKSFSLKNFGEDEICLISVQKSLLPFRKKFSETYITDSYNTISKKLHETKKKAIVIDDAQYLMSNEFMRRATEKGYDKFTEMAKNFWSLIVEDVNQLPDDTIVYILCHTTTDENGIEKMKTIGKLIDETITPEGLFMIVLKTIVSDGNYFFATQNSGKDTVKSPEGMFPSYAIKNDLKYVDEKIRNYYYMDGSKSDEDMEQADKDTAADLEKPERGRRKNTTTAASNTEEKPARRSRKEVEQSNEKKAEEHMEQVSEAIEQVAEGKEEVDFDTAMEAAGAVPKPEMEKIPRATRAERETERQEQPAEQETPTQAPKVRQRRVRG